MKLSSSGQTASLTKRQLQARYTREAKVRLRKAIAQLKAERKTARKQRSLRAPRLRSLCRGSVRRARDRGKALVESRLTEARAEAKALVAAAKASCDRRKETELKKAGRHLAALELEANRARERYLAEKLGGALERQAKATRSSKAERAQESDDEVRANIASELVPVFDKVRRQIKAAPGKSRTEAFEQWLEENAGEMQVMLAKAAEDDVGRMLHELDQRDRLLREMLKRKVVLPSDLQKLHVECSDIESLGLSCDDPADVGHAVDALSKPRQRNVEFDPFEDDDDQEEDEPTKAVTVYSKQVGGPYSPQHVAIVNRGRYGQGSRLHTTSTLDSAAAALRAAASWAASNGFTVVERESLSTPRQRNGEEEDDPTKAELLAAFDKLDAAAGGRYYVPLVDLRKAVRVSRPRFDAALNELRKEWVLTLSPAEGRHEKVPKRILDAGINEQGRNLVYVSRRES